MHRYEIQYRPAPVVGPGGWSTVGSANTLPAADDELASWLGPVRRHGDLARIVRRRHDLPDQDVSLHIFDGERGGFVKVGRPPQTHRGRPNPEPWVEFWEGHVADARFMLEAAGRPLPSGRAVDPRRLALASADFVEWACEGADPARSSPITERVLPAVRSWALGQSTVADFLAVEGVVAAQFGLPMNRQHPRVSQMGDMGDDRPQGVRGFDASTRSLWLAAGDLAEMVAVDSAHPYITAQNCAYRAVAAKLTTRRIGGQHDGRWALAPFMRKWVPLSVELAARLGLRDPLPLSPQANGARGRR